MYIHTHISVNIHTHTHTHTLSHTHTHTPSHIHTYAHLHSFLSLFHQSRKTSGPESVVFWGGLFACPLLWIFCLFTAIIKLNLEWAVSEIGSLYCDIDNSLFFSLSLSLSLPPSLSLSLFLSLSLPLPPSPSLSLSLSLPQIIPIVGIFLTGANVVGYVKCRRDAGAKISAMAGQFIGKQIMNQV